MSLDVESALNKLQDMGLIQLNRPVGDWYSIYCPLPHSGHYEKKPSCGVLLHDQYKGGKKYPAGFFHCFRGDTDVITYDGVKPIAELCDIPDVQILNGDGVWESTKFKNYGNAQLWKIELCRDQVRKIIYATKNHEWFTHPYNKTYTTENLPIGKYLQSYINSAKSFTLDTAGVIHGIIYGDGTRTNNYARHTVDGKLVLDKSKISGVHYQLKIPKFLKKAALVKYFEHLDKWRVKDAKFFGKDYYLVWSTQFPVDHNYKQPPHISCSRDYLMSFLAGYFACDGSIDLMKFHSAKSSELKQIQNICIHCGISTLDITTIQHDTNYLSGAILSSLRIYPNSVPAEFYLLDAPKQTKYSRARWRILSVEPTDIYEDVYCCETSTQSFVLGGNILTHNCFSCGLAKPMPEVLTEVLKNKGIGKSGLDWLKENVPGFESEDVEFDYLIPQDLSQSLQNSYALKYLNSQIISDSKQYVPE
jgi:DNA primase